MVGRRAIAIATAVAPAAVIACVGLWEAYASWADADSAPSEIEWKAVAGSVHAGYKPGDLVVFAPEWIDPIGRMYLGDVIPIGDAARMDAAKYARIWEISSRGGDLRARLYEQTPAHVLADLRDLVKTAKVTGGAARRELAEVGFHPHDCIQVTPAPNQPVRIELPQVALGKTLVGYVGLADVFTRRDLRAPGHLAVEIGGREIARVDPGVEDGWVRFEVATTPGATDIAFVASADAPQRQICFAAEARE